MLIVFAPIKNDHRLKKKYVLGISRPEIFLLYAYTEQANQIHHLCN